LFTRKGCRVIYTSPYTPALQPMELLRVDVKRGLTGFSTIAQSSKHASKCSMHSTETKTASPVNTKLKTKKKCFVRVTPELVKSYTEPSIKACQQFIDADELLDDTIQTLVVKQPTNAQVAQDDQLVIDEAHDIQDKNDTFFWY